LPAERVGRFFRGLSKRFDKCGGKRPESAAHFGSRCGGGQVVSLKEVARKAKVAVSTASLALNNKSRVSPATRARVVEAAKALNYYPHSIARSLKNRRTDTVGFLMGGFGGPVYAELVQSVHDTLAEHGLDMVVCFAPAFGRLTHGRMLDGAIVLDAPTPDRLLEQVVARDMPVVVMDRELSCPNLRSVLLDNRAGSRMLVEYLIARGFRELTFVGGPADSYDSRRRRDGFLSALSAAGLEPAGEVVTDFTEQGGRDAVRGLLENGGPPRMLFCANDETAVGAMQALAERGLRVPDDVAVTGFDDIELARYTTPRLTTVRVPRAAWGAAAAEALVGSIAGRKTPARRMIGVELVVRGSCGAVQGEAS
jgi:LacI family transcriptional regulator